MIDIQAGDVVVCVDDGWSNPCALDPRRGDTLRVREVDWGEFNDGYVGAGLAFVGKPYDYFWSAERFQKIDKATDDFTARIKQPIKQREDA
jgi:hypothetical protein